MRPQAVYNTAPLSFKMKLLASPVDKRSVFAEVDTSFPEYWQDILSSPLRSCIPDGTCAMSNFRQLYKSLVSS